MPITQAKTARNAVAVARVHDAIEMIANLMRMEMVVEFD